MQNCILDPQPVTDVNELHRSFDIKAWKAVLEHYPHLVGDIDKAWDWLRDGNNILLRRGNDFGMLEFEYPGLYTAHYFFDEARGKAALSLAREMLTKTFTEYSARAVQGMTPLWNKKANWMTRRLGFESYGVIEHPDAGECTLFIITLDQFFARNKT